MLEKNKVLEKHQKKSEVLEKQEQGTRQYTTTVWPHLQKAIVTVPGSIHYSAVAKLFMIRVLECEGGNFSDQNFKSSFQGPQLLSQLIYMSSRRELSTNPQAPECNCKGIVIDETPSEENYDEYLFAMKKVTRLSIENSQRASPSSPRGRRRQIKLRLKKNVKKTRDSQTACKNASKIKIIASMVPDEILYNVSDYSIREYDAALMFCDVSGFTDLCEKYAKTGRGGPSLLTQVLNSYIGSMVQEILSHNGDLLKFSGDAFLAMWKSTKKLSMQDVVHAAIDCGIIIQKNYGTFNTDVGINLRVKVAIAGGRAYFALVGDESNSHYAVVGQPVWDVKLAEYLSTAGDVITSPSAWKYVNEAEYATELMADGVHTKILGVGSLWQRVEKIGILGATGRDAAILDCDDEVSLELSQLNFDSTYDNVVTHRINRMELALRPSVNYAMKMNLLENLRRFAILPVMHAVDCDEPMEYLTEMRQVITVFLNIIVEVVSESTLITLLNGAYKTVNNIVSECQGCLNKLSLFDKDMMFLIIFGLRGYKSEYEAENALRCAIEIKSTLDKNEYFKSVSLGVTTGVTYCGVVGHTLRREYTVIGLSVNKAARLMVAYPNRVTCDKETFLRSKLDQENFTLMEPKPLKGLSKVGPIYEFKEREYQDMLQQPLSSYPILGKTAELTIYRETLIKCSARRQKRNKYDKSEKNTLVIQGDKMVGKTRLIDEMVFLTPKHIPVCKFLQPANDKKVPFSMIRRIFANPLGEDLESSAFHTREQKIADRVKVKFNELAYLNAVLNCGFPGSSSLMMCEEFTDEIIDKIKELLLILARSCFPTLWVFAVLEARHVDDWSWKVLPALIESDLTVMIIELPSDKVSAVATASLKSEKVMWLKLSGIDRWYHAAIACQVLDVYAISADLEKVIQTYSDGNPGWIQSFVVSLIQSGHLTIKTVARDQIMNMGLVVPAKAMMVRPKVGSEQLVEADEFGKTGWSLYEGSFRESKLGLDDDRPLSTLQSLVQVAILVSYYNFDTMESSITTDALVLKTYDSLNPFEQLLLKCSSILGEVFSRSMLENVIRIGDKRTIATAVAKLFMIRVLECEGGNFSDQNFKSSFQGPQLLSQLIYMSSRRELSTNPQAPECNCKGIVIDEKFNDLPQYAFCGYMKFSRPIFRETTYDLLTETQKKDFHGRAAMYLERHTRRCEGCGSTSFAKLLGVKMGDGFSQNAQGLSELAQYERSLAEELDFEFLSQEPTHEEIATSLFTKESPNPYNIKRFKLYNNEWGLSSTKGLLRARSYSNLNVANCDCFTILSATYSQIIDHCMGAQVIEKMIEGYVEFADFSIQWNNIPQAIRLLMNLETFALSKEFKAIVENDDVTMSEFRIKFVLGRVMSLRGKAAIQAKDYSQAKKCLHKAMELFEYAFPPATATTFKHYLARVRTRLKLGLCEAFQAPKVTGINASYSNQLAETLLNFYTLYFETNNFKMASLSAHLGWQMAKKADDDFQLLCTAYANVLTIASCRNDMTLCRKLERTAVYICYQKFTQPDIREIPAIAALYLSLFKFKVWESTYEDAYQIGETALTKLMVTVSSSIQKQGTALMLLWLVLAKGDLGMAATILKNYFENCDDFDLSSRTWYYAKCLDILLDTGYCVESYATCESFYHRKGEHIRRNNCSTAAWRYFTAMWLWCVRLSQWEAANLWDALAMEHVSVGLDFNVLNYNTILHMIEGLIICLTVQINHRNLNCIDSLNKLIKVKLQQVGKITKAAPMFYSRFCLIKAYYLRVSREINDSEKYILKGLDSALKSGHKVLEANLVHNQRFWNGSLSPLMRDYWLEHAEEQNKVDYHEIEKRAGRIFPFSLPLPRGFQ